MTKKHFIRIANILKNQRMEIFKKYSKQYPYELQIVTDIENELIDFMKEQNSNFNEFTFCTASNPEPKEIDNARKLAI